MVGRRDDDIQVLNFLWNARPGGNVEHIARHGVLPSDVEEVYSVAPRFFRNTQPFRATHLMVGQNRSGRFLRVAMVESMTAGSWLVATAHWLSRTRGARMYESE